MLSELISVTLACFLLAPAIVLIGLGLRYIFYEPIAWNLDRVYEKYFRGRRRKRYKEFTRRIGFLLFISGLVYFWLIIWPAVKDLLNS